MNDTLTSDVAQAAVDADAAGISVIPVRDDGSKGPVFAWKAYQARRPTPEEINGWFWVTGYSGAAVVCGAVSGGLECLEFDDYDTYVELRNRAYAAGLGDLIGTIEASYVESSPAGGVHWFYRYAAIGDVDGAGGGSAYEFDGVGAVHPVAQDGNQKLAQRPQDAATVKTLIETRGEGGYVIIAPSAGGVHPTGRPYVLRAGAWDRIATLTESQRDDLFELARSFDERPISGPHPTADTQPLTAVERAALGDRPGDEYDREHTWSEILEPLGWRFVYEAGDESYWCRPGKTAGISATANYKGSGLFYVFTTSSAMFEAGQSYSKFAVYTMAEHEGDFTAAAKELSGPIDDPGRLRAATPAGTIDEALRRQSAAATATLSAATPPAALNTPPEAQTSLNAATTEAAKEEAPTLGAIEPQRGGSWIYNAPEGVEAVWGRGDDVLHAAGEPLMIVGPPGVGKTTLAGQYMIALTGIRPQLLGFPVTPASGRVIYVAADRPRQVQRSLKRMVAIQDVAILDERLIIWPGPLPFLLNEGAPTQLRDWVLGLGGAHVFLDSLKDVALDLSEDGSAARTWISIAHAIAAGIEITILHHQRKADGSNKRPSQLDDVYGSRWLTAGMGSVVMLWGDPGDDLVRLYHLKQPANDVGPLELIHDKKAGRTRRDKGADPLALLSDAGAAGLDAKALAVMLFDTDKPNKNHRRRAFRRLRSLVVAGQADETHGDLAGGNEERGSRFYIRDLGPDGRTENADRTADQGGKLSGLNRGEKAEKTENQGTLYTKDTEKSAPKVADHVRTTGTVETLPAGPLPPELPALSDVDRGSGPSDPESEPKSDPKELDSKGLSTTQGGEPSEGGSPPLRGETPRHATGPGVGVQETAKSEQESDTTASGARSEILTIQMCETCGAEMVLEVESWRCWQCDYGLCAVCGERTPYASWPRCEKHPKDEKGIEA